MADLLVWDDKVHLFLGEAIYAHFYVYADFSRVDTDLQHAFTFQITIRVGGIQFWDTGRAQLANGAIDARPESNLSTFGLPVVQGEIDDWDGLDTHGRSAGDNWSNAAVLSFLVSSKADVTLPISHITAALSALGAVGLAARAVLMASALMGKKVRLTLGHSNVVIPLQRDASHKIVQINHVAASAANV